MKRPAQTDYSTQVDTHLQYLKDEWKKTNSQIQLLNDKKERLNFSVFFLVRHSSLTQKDLAEIMNVDPTYPGKLAIRVEKRLKREEMKGEKS